MDSVIFEHRKQAVLYDKKWIIFLKRSWPFRFIPFIEFVLGAGSMVVGDVTPVSDFDVILGAKNGRIFTARFFSILFFGLLGWRRKKIDHQENAADKICLNHFVTEKSYLLSPPYTPSWQKLYQNLIPVFGDAKKIASFFKENDKWAPSRKRRLLDLRYQHRSSSTIKSMLEWVFGGFMGDTLERLTRYVQIARISHSLRKEAGHKPRIKYNDQELEFHPDRKKFEER